MTAAALLSLYLLACLLPPILYSVDSSGVAARDRERDLRERARRAGIDGSGWLYPLPPEAGLHGWHRVSNSLGSLGVCVTWSVRTDRLPASRWGATRTRP